MEKFCDSYVEMSYYGLVCFCLLLSDATDILHGLMPVDINRITNGEKMS